MKDIDEYMEFYNFEHLQEKKNNLTPMEFRYQIAI
ncbi:MAG: IS3 family transposase [Alkalibacterium gilvum]